MSYHKTKGKEKSLRSFILGLFILAMMWCLMMLMEEFMFISKEGKTFPTVLELADDGAVNMQSVIGRCPHCGGEIRVGTKAFNCSNYSNQEAPCSFAIWRNIGGHQLTLEEAKELCEKNITSSELEMYREDGSIYRKRLGLAPDKLQIVKI